MRLDHGRQSSTHRAEIDTKVVSLQTVDGATAELARPRCSCGWCGPFVLFGDDLISHWESHRRAANGSVGGDPDPLFVYRKTSRRHTRDWESILLELRRGG